MAFYTEVNGVIKAMPWIIYGGSLLASVAVNSKLALYFGLGAIIQGKILNMFFKKLMFGNMNGNWKYRPEDIPYEGCGQFSNCNGYKNNRHIGMPSGHSQTMAFSATFWTMYILKKSKKNHISIAILWIIALLVMIDRIRIRCHTVLQVLTGAVFGVILGYGDWLLIEKKILKENLHASLF